MSSRRTCELAAHLGAELPLLARAAAMTEEARAMWLDPSAPNQWSGADD